MRPRIVLVHPSGENFLPGVPDVTRLANVMPPHGLLMLAAVAARRGHYCEIVDGFAEPLGPDALAVRVLAAEPDLVGFSATTSSFLAGYAVAERVKAARPAARVVFGGVHATSIWRRTLQEFPAIDAVVVGEGEETFVELLDAGLLASPDIKGLAFRDAAGEPLYSGPRPHIADLDTLLLPAYDKLRGFPRAYPLPLFNYPRSPATTFITSRGCPYSCSYCDRSVFGSSFRFHGAEYLVDHLAHLRRTYGIRHVNIYDDNFVLRKARVMEFTELLRKRGLGVTFNCIGRAIHLDDEMLKAMKAAGCWMINIGIESADEAILSPHRARAETDGVVDAIHRIKHAGIRVKGLFMLGIPGETEESVRKTVEFATTQPLDDANLTAFTPFPGAPIYETIRAFGTFDERWDRMNCINPVFVPHGFTRKRMQVLYNDFYRQFYGRPKMLWRYLAMAWQSPESWARLIRNAPAFLKAKRALAAHES